MLPRLAACGYSNYHVLRATLLWLAFIKFVVPKMSLLEQCHSLSEPHTSLRSLKLIVVDCVSSTC
jgi:hypothetical protein